MKDPVYSLIDVLHTQTFAEDQIEDTREHANSKIFRCHGSTNFQRNKDHGRGRRDNQFTVFKIER